MARLDARWDNFWQRGQIWYGFDQDGPTSFEVASDFQAASVILVPVSGSLDASAVMRLEQSASIDAASIVLAPTVGSLYASSIILASISGSLDASSVTLKELAFALTIDAVVVVSEAVSGSITSDAVILRPQEVLFTADALVVVPPATFTVDAVVAKTISFVGVSAGSVIVVSHRNRHTRDDSIHFDNDLDTVIELVEGLGAYPRGANLHAVLSDLWSRMSNVEND